MTGSFTKIKALLPDDTIRSFLNHMAHSERIADSDFFIFNQPDINRRFHVATQGSAMDITVKSADFPADTQVIAMTIDGDYILASHHYVYVVPRDLVAEDIEVYELSPIDFFIAFEEERLASHILPNH